MRRWMIILMALGLAACGGDDGTAETSETETAGAESTAEPEAETAAFPAAEEEEPADESPGDGSQCVPVANCNSFANQTCMVVSADGVALGEDGEPSGANVEEACPGGRNVDQSVEACFTYVDRGESCRRAPAVRHAEWPCAWEEGVCRIQSF